MWQSHLLQRAIVIIIIIIIISEATVMKQLTATMSRWLTNS